MGGLDDQRVGGPPLLHSDMVNVECIKGEPPKTTTAETKRETFLNRDILDKNISEQGVKGIGPVREEVGKNIKDGERMDKDMKEKEEEKEEEAGGIQDRRHVGSKEERKVWKQQLLNRWMAPEKDNKLVNGKSIIQKDLLRDTNQRKKRARKEKKACERMDSNQRKVTNWFCKVQKVENTQDGLE